MKKVFYALGIGLVLIAATLCFTAEKDEISIKEPYLADYGQCEKHTFIDDYTLAVPATCSKEGLKYRKCVVCGYIENVTIPIDPDAHSNVPDTWFYETKPTCQTGGYGYRICADCNQKVDFTEFKPDPEAHVKSGDYVVTKAPTCSEAGQKAYECSLCHQYFDMKEIPSDPDAHVTTENSKYEVIKEPTCGVDGEIVYYCDLCGAAAKFSVIPKTEKHISDNILTINAPATCSSPGSESYHCVVCGSPVDSKEIPIDPEAHSYPDEFVIDKKPTCSEEGLKSKKCVYCGKSSEETVIPIDENAHNYSGEFIIDKEPTCSETGQKHKVCSICGENSAPVVIPKTEHTLGAFEVLEKSADGTSAKVKYTCLVCGEEVIDVIVLGDTNNNGNLNEDEEPKITRIVPNDDSPLKVDYKTMIIRNVAPGETVEEFLSEFKNSAIFTVHGLDNGLVSDGDGMATGFKVDNVDKDGAVTEYTVSVTGDINGDGDVTSSDAREILRTSSALQKLENEYFVSADTNGDGKITASDARKTLRVSASLDRFENTLPPIPGL